MDLSLSGKNALVCGSSQGIGKEAAIELALLGANVTLLARNESKLKEVLLQLPATKTQKHNFLVADFSNAAQLSEVIQEWIEKGNRFHILVNNTGGPPAGPANLAGIEEFRIAFNQHLVCNHILATALVPGMKAENYGRIINVISTSVKQPLPNLGVSNTIRGAVASWAKTMANELGKFGITVNNVLPGATETERLAGIISNKSVKTGKSADAIAGEMRKEIPAGRFAKPNEVAAAIAFLASPAASYINGINLPVDGGRTACL